MVLCFGSEDLLLVSGDTFRWQWENYIHYGTRILAVQGHGIWLCNALATLVLPVETVLKSLFYEAHLVYLDDIYRHSIVHIQRAFEYYLEGTRQIKNSKFEIESPSSCNLLCHEFSYLGHIISVESNRTDPDKISPVENWALDIYQLYLDIYQLTKCCSTSSQVN